MSLQAAYAKKIQVSADDGVTWVSLPATSPSLELAGEVLDDTDMASNAGYRKRCLGLHDWSVSADSNLKPLTGNGAADDASGATGLSLVRAAKLARTDLLVRYLPTGAVDATGLTGTVVVENIGYSGDVAGQETVSITLQGSGALAAAA